MTGKLLLLILFQGLFLFEGFSTEIINEEDTLFKIRTLKMFFKSTLQPQNSYEGELFVGFADGQKELNQIVTYYKHGQHLEMVLYKVSSLTHLDPNFESTITSGTKTSDEMVKAKKELLNLLAEKYPFFVRLKNGKQTILKGCNLITPRLDRPFLSCKEDKRGHRFFSLRYKGNKHTMDIINPFSGLNLESYKYILEFLRVTTRSTFDNWAIRVFDSPICDLFLSYQAKFSIPDICLFRSMEEQRDDLLSLWKKNNPRLLQYFNVFIKKKTPIARFYHWSSERIGRRIFMKGIANLGLIRHLNKVNQPEELAGYAGVYISQDFFSASSHADFDKPGLYLIDIKLKKISQDTLMQLTRGYSPLDLEKVHYFNLRLPIKRIGDKSQRPLKISSIDVAPPNTNWFVIEEIRRNYSIKHLKSKKDFFPLELEKLKKHKEKFSTYEIPKKFSQMVLD